MLKELLHYTADVEEEHRLFKAAAASSVSRVSSYQGLASEQSSTFFGSSILRVTKVRSSSGKNVQTAVTWVIPT